MKSLYSTNEAKVSKPPLFFKDVPPGNATKNSL
jgi:hypothetical protein